MANFDTLGSNAYWKEDEWLKSLRKYIGTNTLKRLKKEQLVQEILNLRQILEEENSFNKTIREENDCLKFVIEELQSALRASHGVIEPDYKEKENGSKIVH